ncbi:hypothetical protein ElyMa_001368000 [Elysia marginata]|uniref:G-protein coupled receptors family 1 profile domain-containing protein n=1 Tax=Elysia marginata TaxID=1093978 RepID=A0AAV4ISN7_9GAST|nr:hypothetical protein ElyMa_001368000 [Elysia marginata]
MNESTALPSNISTGDFLRAENASSLRNRILGGSGMLFNIVAVLLLSMSRRIRPPVKLALISMSTTDLILMTTAAIWSPDLPCFPAVYIISSSILISYFMTALLAFHNYVAVFYPTRYQQILSLRKSLVAVVCCWLCGYLILLGCLGMSTPNCSTCYIIAYTPRLGLVVESSVCLLCAICTIALNLLVLVRIRQRDKKSTLRTLGPTTSGSQCPTREVEIGDRTCCTWPRKRSRSTVLPLCFTSSESQRVELTTSDLRVSSMEEFLPSSSSESTTSCCSALYSSRSTEQTKPHPLSKQGMEDQVDREDFASKNALEPGVYKGPCTSRIHHLEVPKARILNFTRKYKYPVNEISRRCFTRDDSEPNISGKNLPAKPMLQTVTSHSLATLSPSTVDEGNNASIYGNKRIYHEYNDHSKQKKIKRASNLNGPCNNQGVDNKKFDFEDVLSQQHQMYSEEKVDCQNGDYYDASGKTCRLQRKTGADSGKFKHTRKRLVSDCPSVERQTLEMFSVSNQVPHALNRMTVCSSLQCEEPALHQYHEMRDFANADFEQSGGETSTGGITTARLTSCTSQEDCGLNGNKNIFSNFRQIFSTSCGETQVQKRNWRNRTQYTLLILCSWCCFLSLPFVIYGAYVAIWVEDRISFSSSKHGIFISSLAVLNSLTNPLLYAWRFFEWRDIWRTLRRKTRSFNAQTE